MLSVLFAVVDRLDATAADAAELSGAELRAVQKEIAALDRALSKLADRINAKHVEIADHDQSESGRHQSVGREPVR